MGQGRTNRGCLIGLLIVGLFVLLSILGVFTDPYDSARGVRGVSEFVGKPVSFAEKKLGRPSRDFSFAVGDIGDRMPRADVPQRVEGLPTSAMIREVSWEKASTFVTVWYRADTEPVVAIDALQWDKRITEWAKVMEAPPSAATRPAP